MGDLYDHESLVKAIKQVDVVISAVGMSWWLIKLKIIAAIKKNLEILRVFSIYIGARRIWSCTASGQLGKCFPNSRTENSGYGWRDPIRFFPSEFGMDVDRINAVEPAKSTFAFSRSHCSSSGTKVIIPGDGNVKAVFNEEHDIGTYTIKAVDDRALNKSSTSSLL
ncbi:hypothetical protein HAX54_037785 [Datura stramonium]|uniref:Uncharacterized protein n=1 Tax=Datura stramonium TaxID=4076 RepID=A0ABS8SH88_DATST|nr:hypothetical protein [Datura stramonium]